MCQISILWINIIQLSVAYTAIDNSAYFPYDLIAESSDNIASKVSDKTKGDDEKRTLSQQVAEGKYGLLHKELFSKPVQRPGIISYSSNSEVPNDNASNFGGLNKSDIWLAENHLLVIKGGFYPLLETLPEYSKPVWPPIDDYNAPRRQVKIPKHPKVPPPFPVQLTDGGPLQILGTNYTRNINDTYFPPEYPIPPVEGTEQGNGPFYPPQYPYPSNTPPGKTPFPGSPYPPAISGNNEGGSVISGGSLLPPFFDALPPGTAILPPPNNTDQYDEDDLSIYYPPPYSFYYPIDNTTQVPPGPLVPGIVLPPPPNFFGPLEKSTTTPKPTSTTKPPQRTKPDSVTKLRPVKTKPTTIYIYDNHIPNQPFAEYGPPPPKKISITATKIPLRAYFTTSSETDYVNNKKPEKQFYYYDSKAPETNNIPPQFVPVIKNQVNNSNNYNAKPHFYYLPPPINNFKTHIVELEEQIRSYEKPNRFQQNTYKKPVPKPVYQYSFEVSNYKEQHNKLQGNMRPKYTVQIEPAIELTTTPTPTYYQPNYNYQAPQTITRNPSRGYVATVNPIYDTAHTKQDDKFLSDISKTYFTTFGKRIKATTPLPLVHQYSITKPRTNVESIKSINVQNYDYKIRPSAEAYLPETNAEALHSIRIPNQPYQRPVIQDSYSSGENEQYSRTPDVQPIQAINIDQPFIPIRQQKTNNDNRYFHIIKPNVETINAENIPTQQNSYVQLRKQPNIQTIHAISLEPDQKPGSFISYQLPGDDGAHFYFLTPQLAQNGEDSQPKYYYPQHNSPRIPRHS